LRVYDLLRDLRAIWAVGEGFVATPHSGSIRREEPYSKSKVGGGGEGESWKRRKRNPGQEQKRNDP